MRQTWNAFRPAGSFVRSDFNCVSKPFLNRDQSRGCAFLMRSRKLAESLHGCRRVAHVAEMLLKMFHRWVNSVLEGWREAAEEDFKGIAHALAEDPESV